MSAVAIIATATGLSLIAALLLSVVPEPRR